MSISDEIVATDEFIEIGAIRGWLFLEEVLYCIHTRANEQVRPQQRESMRLKDTTFILGDKPMKTLLWCNKVPKGKRNKPSKINGIQHHEISESVEHTYYQPLWTNVTTVHHRLTFPPIRAIIQVWTKQLQLQLHTQLTSGMVELKNGKAVELEHILTSIKLN